MVTTIAKSSKHLDIILLYSVAKDILSKATFLAENVTVHSLQLLGSA